MILDEDVLERELKREFAIPLNVAVSDEPIPGSQLTPGELARFMELESTPRCVSWLKGRSALKRLLACLGQSPDTSNILFPNPRFSLTHSGDYALAVGIVTPSLSGIGLDLEVNRHPHPKSGRFFLNQEEHGWLMDLKESTRPDHLLRLWTVKEALFKSYPGNQETSLVDYALEDPERQSGRAFVHGMRSLEIRYCSLLLAHGVLSMAIFPKRRRRDA